MNNNKSSVAQVGAVFCFIFSAVAVALATWLFKEGQIPKLRLAPHVYVGFGNGDALSNVFFYIFVTVLFGTSVALFFTGYRLWRRRA
jgi:hypothetical protein